MSKMDGQYKLEDFGEVILRNDDGTPLMAYRDIRNKDTQQEQLSFKEEVKELVNKYPNDMELGGKIRELCYE